MNKHQGLTVGAILLAGLLARTVSPNQAEIREAPRRVGSVTARSTAPGMPHESDTAGPWIASCNYWSSVRSSLDARNSAHSSAAKDASAEHKKTGKGKPNPSDESHRQEFTGKMTAQSGRIDLQFALDEEDGELGCPNAHEARWGFPDGSSEINVTTIIATVPDPAHTHLAMVFDRTIAALLQAAQDNGYLSSYYWVPWKRHGEGGNRASEEADGEEPGHDPVRERQPGLLVLKSKSLNKVIYIFLVGENPTEGVDGFQLQNAFQYEDEIRGLVENRGHFARGRDGHISIIGPIYSGSAASLRAGIEFEAGNKDHRHNPGDIFDVNASTSTTLAADTLSSSKPVISFHSFDANGAYAQARFLDYLAQSGYDLSKIAFLTESNTTFANATSAAITKYSLSLIPTKVQPLFIIFPREISLLRNAQEERESEQGESSGTNAPSPFLHLSLKDSNPTDSIPLFSRENTPLSQEAQLMAISRQLNRHRVEYIAIIASNPLDSIFLAQFLHRACPDARLLFFSSDLLMEREIDNVPFVGTTSVTPYPLFGWRETSVFPDSASEIYYNAASFVLWDRHYLAIPALQGYFPVTLTNNKLSNSLQPSLWISAIGTDGYYPLGMLSICSGYVKDEGHYPPAIGPKGEILVPYCSNGGLSLVPSNGARTIFPALLWNAMCLCILGLCIVHSLMLLAADYWSPVTRDLSIKKNVEKHRRSMYINVAAAMLFSMACVISLPALALTFTASVSGKALSLAFTTLVFGIVAAVVSLRKVAKFHGYVRMSDEERSRPGWVERLHRGIIANIYFCINIIAWSADLVIPGIWLYLCFQERADSAHHTGVFFSYRCVNPGSGVSPLVPVLLLLLGWYVWAYFQTRRLRFSESERPRLPRKPDLDAHNRFFVSDEKVCGTEWRTSHNTSHNVMTYASCRFITRKTFRQALENRSAWVRRALDFLLLLLYLTGLVWCSVFDPIRGLNHIFWTHKHIADPYEFLMGLLFFPLVVVALAGWLRAILMWNALRNGLLERLERQPIRLAFSRLKGFGWMGMLRQSGFNEQMRDMARAVESIRYILHEEDIETSLRANGWTELNNANCRLGKAIEDLRRQADSRRQDGPKDYLLVQRIEEEFSVIGNLLLTRLLIPYWEEKRTGLVDGEEVEELPMKARRWEIEGEMPHFPIQLRAAPEPADPAGVIAAQEFIALRYVALIRAVLANLRSLWAFISVAFVLCIVAWHAYPFQPRQQVDWLCTGLFLILSIGIVWVFAQMYRNPILSRITDTHPNELGWEFYLRILAFGAIPVLTWLAYQFPDLGNMVFKLFRPAVDVIK
jgi:hypothetical protein